MMTVVARRLFYSAAIFLFAVIAPLLILYVQGYRLDLKHGFVFKTGALAVDSSPTGGAIFLDGEYRGRTPRLVTGLYPGTYALSVERPGFQRWATQATVSVNETATSAAVLLPAAISMTHLAIPDAKSVAYTERTGTLAVASNDSAGSVISLYQTGSRTFVPLTRVNGASPEKLHLSWSPRGKYLAVVTNEGRAAVINAETPNAAPSLSVNGGVTRLVWDPATDSMLYAVANGSLWQYDLLSKSSRVVASPSVLDVLFDNTPYPWIIRRTGTNYSIEQLNPLAVNNRLQQLAIVLPVSRLLAANERTLLASGEHLIATINPRSAAAQTISTTGTASAVLDRDKRQALIRTPVEVWTASLSSGEFNLVTRQSQVDGAAWCPQPQCVLVLAGNVIQQITLGSTPIVTGSFDVQPGSSQLIQLSRRTFAIPSPTELTLFSLP